MDFSRSEEQQALGALAEQVFADGATHERLRSLETSGEAIFDRDLWAACAQSGLLGAVVPEAHGGTGMGLLELVPVFEAQGRHVAPLPLVETLVTALFLREHASDAQRAALLPGVASGDVVLTCGLDDGAGGDARVPAVQAVPRSATSNWVVSGVLPFVPYAAEATRIIVPVATPTDTAFALVDPNADGVTVTPLAATNRQPVARVELEDVDVPPDWFLHDQDADVLLVGLVQRLQAAWCVVQAGVTDGAVRMTASYVSERRQFDKVIAEFQAVAQRAADAFIDAQMIHLTALHAAYRLSQGLDAAAEVHTAKFWAGDGAMRAVHAAQHLHGGIGVDLDYPVHRYFLWAKRIEHTLGTPTRELLRLGNLLADQAV